MISLRRARTRKEQKERQQRDARALWLACHTQEEIAEKVGVTHQTISNWMEEFTKLSETNNLVNLSREENAAAWHVTDFKPPISTIWRAHDKTNGNGVEHHGNSDVRWLDHPIMRPLRKFAQGLSCREEPHNSRRCNGTFSSGRHSACSTPCAIRPSMFVRTVRY